MQGEQDALWAEVMCLMKHHQKPKDATPIAALNRIFTELVPDGFVVTPKSCRVRREEFTWKQLSGFVRKDMASMEPRHIGDPIIVVDFKGGMYVVDGRRRVNRWIAERFSESLEAIVVQCPS